LDGNLTGDEPEAFREFVDRLRPDQQ